MLPEGEGDSELKRSADPGHENYLKTLLDKEQREAAERER
jgi:hypothetical protein